MTAQDVRLTFAEQYEVLRYAASGSRKMRIEERVSVTMGWRETKLLLDLLSDIVGKYEEVNGEIKEPRLP